MLADAIGDKGRPVPPLAGRCINRRRWEQVRNGSVGRYTFNDRPQKQQALRSVGARCGTPQLRIPQLRAGDPPRTGTGAIANRTGIARGRRPASCRYQAEPGDARRLRGWYSRRRAARRWPACKLLAEQALEQVRAISHNLHPPDWQGLATGDALVQLVESSGLMGRLEVAMDIRPLPAEPSHTVKIAIYRCAQECISNIARHSGATRFSLSLMANGPMLELRLEAR